MGKSKSKATSGNGTSGSGKLEEGLKQLEAAATFLSNPDLLPKMEKYISELILFNSAYNLTNTSDFDEISVNHILDSLSAAAILKNYADTLQQNFSEKIMIADIGSGGGLPGIPLAATLPEHNFTLVERMDKRCAFLENEAAILGLKNVTVLKKEAEKVPAESFHLVTFRAFRPLDKAMIKTLLSLTKTGGIIAAYKAKIQSIKEEMEGIKDIVPEYSVLPLEVPFLSGHERNLVIIKKN